VHEIIGRLILLNRSHSPSHRILGFGQLDREDAPQACCRVELFRIPKGFGCVERRQAGRGAGVHAPKPSSHSGRIVGKPLQQQNPSGVGHGSEGTWKSTLRFRRSSVKTVIMRSRVRLTMSGFLPPLRLSREWKSERHGSAMVFPTYDAIRDQTRFMRLTHALNLPT